MKGFLIRLLTVEGGCFYQLNFVFFYVEKGAFMIVLTYWHIAGLSIALAFLIITVFLIGSSSFDWRNAFQLEVWNFCWVSEWVIQREKTFFGRETVSLLPVGWRERGNESTASDVAIPEMGNSFKCDRSEGQDLVVDA